MTASTRDFFIERDARYAGVYVGGDQLAPDEYDVGAGVHFGGVGANVSACQCGTWSATVFAGPLTVQMFDSERVVRAVEHGCGWLAVVLHGRGVGLRIRVHTQQRTEG